MFKPVPRQRRPLMILLATSAMALSTPALAANEPLPDDVQSAAKKCGAFKSSISNLNQELEKKPLEKLVSGTSWLLGLGQTLCDPEVTEQVLLARVQEDTEQASQFFKALDSVLFGNLVGELVLLPEDSRDQNKLQARAEKNRLYIEKRARIMRAGIQTLLQTGPAGDGSAMGGTSEQLGQVRDLLNRIQDAPVFRATGGAPKLISNLQYLLRASLLRELDPDAVDLTSSSDVFLRCLIPGTDTQTCDSVLTYLKTLLQQSFNTDKSPQRLQSIFRALDRLEITMIDLIEGKKADGSMLKVETVTSEQAREHIKKMKASISEFVRSKGDAEAKWWLAYNGDTQAFAEVKKEDPEKVLQAALKDYILPGKIPSAEISLFLHESWKPQSDAEQQALLRTLSSAYREKASGWLELFAIAINNPFRTVQEARDMVQLVLEQSSPFIVKSVISRIMSSDSASELQPYVEDRVRLMAAVDLATLHSTPDLQNTSRTLFDICRGLRQSDPSTWQVCQSEVVSQLTLVRDELTSRYKALGTQPESQEEKKITLDAIKLVITSIKRLQNPLN